MIIKTIKPDVKKFTIEITKKEIQLIYSALCTVSKSSYSLYEIATIESLKEEWNSIR